MTEKFKMATVDGLFNSINTKLEAPVRTHLKSVYACLTMSIMSAAGGAYTHMFTNLLRGGGIGKCKPVGLRTRLSKIKFAEIQTPNEYFSIS